MDGLWYTFIKEMQFSVEVLKEYHKRYLEKKVTTYKSLTIVAIAI